MPLIYRSMLRDGNRPKIGPDKRMLGVKVAGDQYDDITPDSTGNVYPATGGMSVSPAWRELPPHRIPKRLRVICPKAAGNNSTECWRLGSGPFESGTVADRLDLRVDSQTHGLVEPATIMSLDAYQDALGDTADHWSIDPETRAENDSPSV
jgi:hypothetical protein